MPLKNFICTDGIEIDYHKCLEEGGCRMKARCATRSYLRLVSNERVWTGKPSTTQLIQGTKAAFLKLTKDYSISPDGRAFMALGTGSHTKLQGSDDEYSILEEKLEDFETGILDVFEKEHNKSILADYKTSGSYKVAKALGFYVVKKGTGVKYKTGKRKGEERTESILMRDDKHIDRFDWDMQLNKYRIALEKQGFPVDEMRVQCIVRDGGCYLARSRGVFRNIYYFPIQRIPDAEVLAYFKRKREALALALKQGYWKEPCIARENWDGIKCARYCEVADYCPYGKYLKREKEKEDMPIKNLSEIRRLPRMGKIRLGIKKVSSKGVEYPAEIDYFKIDPGTPAKEENEKIAREFHKLYGEKPKQINIMFPTSNPEEIFPQYYKRYGQSTSLQCKGDGIEATCSAEEFAEGLDEVRKSDLGLPVVKCLGRECSYYKNKKCSESATLQILLPELPGAGVWQITTGSFYSITNINSCLEFIKSVAGRFHMIPLKLERRPQETQFEGQKRTHYILHIDMSFKLKDLQQYANIDSSKVLLGLPAIEETREDVVFQDTPDIEEAQVKEEKATEGEWIPFKTPGLEGYKWRYNKPLKHWDIMKPDSDVYVVTKVNNRLYCDCTAGDMNKVCKHKDGIRNEVLPKEEPAPAAQKSGLALPGQVKNLIRLAKAKVINATDEDIQDTIRDITFNQANQLLNILPKIEQPIEIGEWIIKVSEVVGKF